MYVSQKNYQVFAYALWIDFELHSHIMLNSWRTLSLKIPGEKGLSSKLKMSHQFRFCA